MGAVRGRSPTSAVREDVQAARTFDRPDAEVVSSVRLFGCWERQRGEIARMLTIFRFLGRRRWFSGEAARWSRRASGGRGSGLGPAGNGLGPARDGLRPAGSGLEIDEGHSGTRGGRSRTRGERSGSSPECSGTCRDAVGEVAWSGLGVAGNGREVAWSGLRVAGARHWGSSTDSCVFPSENGECASELAD